MFVATDWSGSVYVKNRGFLLDSLLNGAQINDRLLPALKLLVLYFCFLSAASGLASAEKTPLDNAIDFKQVAGKIDALLNLQPVADQTPTTIDDPTFLSRVWLDLVGIRPTAEDIHQFLRNNDPEKRNTVVKQRLSDSRFGTHWGRYWRDTILARRADERALRLVSDSLTDAVAKRINDNVRWDQIATDFITASGDVRERGETGLFLAQKGEPEGITAEVARIFLGIQIQCAQCHDHPTDQWKREQFHQLAAFFPRVGIRRVREANPRSFEVYSRNKQGRKKKSKNKKSLEHYMPDLAHPDTPGKITKPVFFLTGHSLDLGTADQDRREALAHWITDPEANPWFARAYVNRVWTELIGHGFYASVDDIGPDHDCIHPEVLALLAQQFAETGYDTKWLFQTIMHTTAYQSALPGLPRETSEKTSLQPLRSDVIFDNLVRVLDIAGTEKGQLNKNQHDRTRRIFQQAFFYDPSLPRDEVNPTIPQALLLMNSPQIHQRIRGDRPTTMLGRLLAEQHDNELVIENIYVRCLGRLPDERELFTCLKHIKARQNRIESFEDILWSLLNTAEFRQRN